MTIEINLLGGGMISGPMLLMLLILTMIAWDKRGGSRGRGSANEGKGPCRLAACRTCGDR